MSKKGLIIEDDTKFQKTASKGSSVKDTNTDISSYTELEEEISKIPKKYPNKNGDSDDDEDEKIGDEDISVDDDDDDVYNSSEETPKESKKDKENLKMNLVKSSDARDKNEDTDNLAYSRDQKQDDSNYEEDYDEDEDFEKIEDKNEAQSSKRSEVARNEEVSYRSSNVNGDENVEPEAGDKSEKNGSEVNEDEKYTEEFENEEEGKGNNGEQDDEEVDPDEERDKVEIGKPQNPKSKPIATVQPKKGIVTKPSKRPTPSKKPPLPSQKPANKDFKVRTIQNNKEGKKENPQSADNFKELKKAPVKLKPVVQRPATASTKTKSEKDLNATENSNEEMKKERPSTAKKVGLNTGLSPTEILAAKSRAEKLKANSSLHKDKAEVAERVLKPHQPNIKVAKSKSELEDTTENEDGEPQKEKSLAAKKKTLDTGLSAAAILAAKAKAEKPKVSSSLLKEEPKDADEDDEKQPKLQQQSILIRKAKKVEHKDIMKQIYDDYKKKEEISRKKDEKIFASEETEKRIRDANDDGQSSSTGNRNMEDNWMGNGIGLSTNAVKAVRKRPQSQTGREISKAQDMAKKFLEGMQKKIKKAPQIHVEEKEDANEFGFNEEKIEAGDNQAPMSRNEVNEIESLHSQIGGSGSKGKKKNNSNKNEEQENMSVNTWDSASGKGIPTEYEKKEKQKEWEIQRQKGEASKKERREEQEKVKESTKKFKESLKDDLDGHKTAKGVQKAQEQIFKSVMKKEQELKSTQQQQLIKDVRSKVKTCEKEERDPYVLPVQNIYLEEERRHKKECEKDEIRKLRLQCKLLEEQKVTLDIDLKLAEAKDDEKRLDLEKLTKSNAAVFLGKLNFTSLAFGAPSAIAADSSSALKLLDDGSSFQRAATVKSIKSIFDIDKLKPIEKIVNKFSDMNLDLGDVYELLDQNGDGVLTVNEIKEGLIKYDLNLNDDEIMEIVQSIDVNDYDNLITREEFVEALRKKMVIRKEYKSIVGEIDVSNPMILEERKLDIDIRTKIVTEKMKEKQKELKDIQKEYSASFKELADFENQFGVKKEVDHKQIDFYRSKIQKLKYDIEDAEESKKRMQIMQRERKNEIEYILIDLEGEIKKVIDDIHNRKEKINELTRKQQEANIKRIFIERTMNEHAEKMNKYNSEIDEKNQMMVADIQQADAGFIQMQSEEIIGTHMANNAAATVLQSRFRAKKAKNLFLQLKAKQRILKNWRNYKQIKSEQEAEDQRKIREQEEREAEEEKEAREREIREEEEREREKEQKQEQEEKSERSEEHSDQEDNKEHSARFIEEIEEDGNEALPDRDVAESQTQSVDENKLKTNMSRKNKSTRHNQQVKRLTFAATTESEDENEDDDKIEKQSQGENEDEHDDKEVDDYNKNENQNEDKDLRLSVQPKISIYLLIFLQNKIIARWPDRKNVGVVLYNDQGKIVEKCSLCQSAIKRICNDCESTFFCLECFNKTHKAWKNHSFLDILANRNLTSELIEQIWKESPDDMIKFNEFKERNVSIISKLKERFEDWDTSREGHVKLTNLGEILRNIAKKSDKDFIMKFAKTYCTKEDDQTNLDYTLLTNLLNS